LFALASGGRGGPRLVLNISSQIAAGQTVAVNDADALKPPLDARR
jgi:hypothetical protein